MNTEKIILIGLGITLVAGIAIWHLSNDGEAELSAYADLNGCGIKLKLS